MVCEIEVFPDGSEEILLLTVAQAIMIRFIIKAECIVAADEVSIGAELRVVDPQRLGLGVSIDICALPFGGRLVSDDGNAAFRAHDIFHEESDLAHHRTPASFIPPDGAVLKSHLQRAVINFPFRKFIRQTSSDARDTDRLRACHLTHHIHIVDAAIDDRGNRRHQVLVSLPVRSG